MGRALLVGRGLPEDHKEAVRRLKRGCDLKEQVGCAGLAAAHGLGRGVEQDLDKALGYNVEACEIGDSQACAAAAQELMTRKDDNLSARIRELWGTACRIGDGGACGVEAMMASLGLGGDKDLERAKTLWQEGCRRADLKSCAEVMRMGLEPEVIEERKPMVYDAACRSGVASACPAGAPTGPSAAPPNRPPGH
jgi:TPR repeat protein